MSSNETEFSEDYTTTAVLLGYASKEPTEDSISQLGGRPSWLYSSSPNGLLAKCRVCNAYMALLLQLHGDLPEHFASHERRLHIFACKRKTCSRKEDSIRAVRSTRVGNVATKTRGVSNQHRSPVAGETTTQPVQDLGSSIFGAKPGPLGAHGLNPFTVSSSTPANPFSIGLTPDPVTVEATKNPSRSSEALSHGNLPQTFAQKMNILSTHSPAPSPPRESWPTEAELPVAYPTYHLDADYEALDVPIRPTAPLTTMDLDDPDCNTASVRSKEDVDTFESTIDKTFQRFADRLAENAQQVLRYEFKGSPLLYSKTDIVGKMLSSPSPLLASENTISGIPRCTTCGEERVFELQLVPHAIVELETDDNGLEGMEWGTIILGVCSKDCQAKGVGEGQVGYLEEWVGVQWEERSK